MTAQLAAPCSVWIGLAAIFALVVLPQAALVVWALRNPNQEGSDHA